MRFFGKTFFFSYFFTRRSGHPGVDRRWHGDVIAVLLGVIRRNDYNLDKYETGKWEVYTNGIRAPLPRACRARIAAVNAHLDAGENAIRVRRAARDKDERQKTTFHVISRYGTGELFPGERFKITTSRSYCNIRRTVTK